MIGKPLKGSPMTKAYIDATLSAALAAANEAALAQWKRDGEMDCGSCGGMMVQLSGRSSIGRAALALGVAYQSGSTLWLSIKAPEPIRSQHAEIQIRAYTAFMAVVEKAGFKGAFGRHWTFVD